jgi:hypothetical protein
MNSPKEEDHNISNFETLQCLIIDLFIYLFIDGPIRDAHPNKKKKIELRWSPTPN